MVRQFFKQKIRFFWLLIALLSLALTACELPSPSVGDVQVLDGETSLSDEGDTSGDTGDVTAGEGDEGAAGDAADSTTDTTDSSTEDSGQDSADDSSADQAGDTADEGAADTGSEGEDAGDATSEDSSPRPSDDAAADAGSGEGDATDEAAAGEGEASEGETTDAGQDTAAETTDSGSDDSAAQTGAESTDAAAAPGVHIVAAGENLYRIGLKYNVSWTTLATFNNIANPNSLQVGQEIKIPSSEAETPDPSVTPIPTDETVYVVQPGDNLFLIGLQYGLDWTQIAEANGLVNPNFIQAGQVLKIPADQPGSSPEFTHVVAQGETLFLIALRYGVTWPAIAEKNEIEAPYVIYVGQPLIIPGGQ